MAFRLKQSESVSKSVRRIAREQIEKAIEEIEAPKLTQSKKVHQVRKRCKKLRGLVRLVRYSMTDDYPYSNANALFRDIAKPLSEARDSKIYLDTFDALLEQCANAKQRARFQSIRDQLSQHRQHLLHDEVDVETQLGEARGQFSKAFKDVRRWRFNEKEYDAWGPGFGETYSRARTAFRDAQSNPSTEVFHEWRKRVKYHSYHCKLLRFLWPALMKCRQSEGEHLGDWLGVHHDLAVLKRHIADSPTDYGNRKVTNAFVDLIDKRSAQLESSAFRLGEKMFAESTKKFLKRHRRYWKSIR
ncbi:CHAD domain containing protein [Rhodopirellula maiorica SM1]|uniref:CHAD domain containing protein n=1 Tax=Rhodopirellula maiorica SM1 TaxID=1265738 RepID=M5RDF7_9BACT|nr:CHAD domain-containing protein [Rhodopirellula maiorica]EMI17415.1 CHAD domain containing protein [Rhodopirellula maiorica SM1]